MKFRALLVIVFMLAAALVGFAQGSTFQVFPQVVDGVLSDGSSYYSLLSIENLSGNPTTCSLFSSGVPLDRFAITATRFMPPYYSSLNVTHGTGSFVSGYMTVSCTQPVQASVMYLEVDPNGFLESMATVSSAPPIHYASFLAMTGLPFAYGIAIANTSSVAISLTFTVNFPDGTFTQRTVQVSGNSRFVHFLSDFLPIPASLGLVNVEVNSNSTFNVTALLYNGTRFTTLVPAVVP